MNFNKKLIPAGMPKEKIKIVEKAFYEVVEVLNRYETDFADFIVLACTLFDVTFEDRSIEAMEVCMNFMEKAHKLFDEEEE